MSDSVPIATPHPTRATRRRDQRVRRKRTELEKAHPHLSLPRNRSTTRRWAELVVLGNQIYEKLTQIGVLDEHGQPRALIDVFRRIALAQVHLERELLLTEKSRHEMPDARKPTLDLEILRAQVVDEPD